MSSLKDWASSCPTNLPCAELARLLSGGPRERGSSTCARSPCRLASTASASASPHVPSRELARVHERQLGGEQRRELGDRAQLGAELHERVRPAPHERRRRRAQAVRRRAVGERRRDRAEQARAAAAVDRHAAKAVVPTIAPSGSVKAMSSSSGDTSGGKRNTSWGYWGAGISLN